jgi:hypothetical protein
MIPTNFFSSITRRWLSHCSCGAYLRRRESPEEIRWSFRTKGNCCRSCQRNQMPLVMHATRSSACPFAPSSAICITIYTRIYINTYMYINAWWIESARQSIKVEETKLERSTLSVGCSSSFIVGPFKGNFTIAVHSLGYFLLFRKFRASVSSCVCVDALSPSRCFIYPRSPLWLSWLWS